MGKNFDYTAVAQRFVARFPLFTYILTQITFWIFANILLGVIIHLHALSISETLDINASTRFTPILIITVILGVLYGIILGLIDYYLDRSVFKKFPLGKLILFKTIVSLVVLALIIAFLRYILYDPLQPISYNVSIAPSPKSWEYLFYLFSIYYLVMTLVINFINQINKKYGPGVLIPLLLGKYRNPKEQERIFMFMDLKSSTSMAEKLGHLKYSAFIRDCFFDINQVLFPFNAQVYQYVGDEIVVTWNLKDGLKNFLCIRFFFACEKQFLKRFDYYTKNYGTLPGFKASLHMGKVTAVEIGEIKRDIAYHGDTLNTAARIQSVCNEHKQKFLVSQYLLNTIGLHQNLKTTSLGIVNLRGKTEGVEIASADWVDDDLG